jgi:hypothetical protein
MKMNIDSYIDVSGVTSGISANWLILWHNSTRVYQHYELFEIRKFDFTFMRKLDAAAHQ